MKYTKPNTDINETELLASLCGNSLNEDYYEHDPGFID